MNNSQFYKKRNGKIVQFCAKVLSVDYSHGLIEAVRWDIYEHIEASWSGCKDIQEGETYWFKPAGHDRGGNIEAKYVLLRPRRRIKWFGDYDGVSEQEEIEAKVISDALTKNYDLNKILKHLLNAAKIAGEASLKFTLWTEYQGRHEYYRMDMTTSASFSWLSITAKRRGKVFHGSLHRGWEAPKFRYLY